MGSLVAIVVKHIQHTLTATVKVSVSPGIHGPDLYLGALWLADDCHSALGMTPHVHLHVLPLGRPTVEIAPVPVARSY